MSHGRSHLRQPRAPLARLSVAPRRQELRNPLRIGPPLLRTADQWHELGIRQEQTGNVLSAISSYRQALQLDNQNLQLVFDLAYALAEAGQIDSAIERYRQVLEADATRVDAWCNLGDLLLRRGQIAAAVEALHQGLSLNPLDPDLHYNLADALDPTAPQSARQHWRAFLRLGGGSPERMRYARCRIDASACRF